RENRRAHRLQQTGRDELEQTNRRQLPLGVRLVGGEDRIVPSLPRHRQDRRHADRRDAGHRGDAIGNRLMHAHDGVRILHLRARNAQAEREHLFRAREAGIDVAERLEVRIISPALTSSTSASATCTTTSVLRARWRSRLALDDRPPPRRPAATSAPAYFTTGIVPKSRPAAIEIASVKRSTVASIEMSSSRGRLPGASAISTRTAPYATASPTAPPTRPRTTLSASSS